MDAGDIGNSKDLMIINIITRMVVQTGTDRKILRGKDSWPQCLDLAIRGHPTVAYLTHQLMTVMAEIEALQMSCRLGSDREIMERQEPVNLRIIVREYAKSATKISQANS